MNCHAMAKGPGGHHVMPGLPDWALYVAVGLAAVLCLVSLRGGWLHALGPRGWRLELTAWWPVRWLLGRRPFQFALQVPLVLALIAIIYTGLRGTPVPERNLSTVMTWSVWWTLLVVDIVLLGRTWCLVCPWDALASWLRRLAFWRRTSEPLALNLPWPRWLRNVYPATLLFVGLTWLELGWGVTLNPRATAYLGLLMVLLAVVPALLFERRSFCKHVCLVGRICGLYSMMAPVELRARNNQVCRDCETKDCLRGNDQGYACPTGVCPGTLDANTYCTLCTECVKTCPHDNVAVNLRPWGEDLHTLGRPRRDEALLALVMLSMTSFHGLTMTPVWNDAVNWIKGASGLPHLGAFSLGMMAVLLVPSTIYLSASAATTRLGHAGQQGLWQVAASHAYPLVAVALMYHLAHNAGHFLTEAGAVLPVLSDPMGTGQLDLLGLGGWQPSALASQNVIWTMQVALVLAGHLVGLRAGERARQRLLSAADAPASLSQRLVPAAFLLLCTAANLWLLAQPMEMRSAM